MLGGRNQARQMHTLVVLVLAGALGPAAPQLVERCGIAVALPAECWTVDPGETTKDGVCVFGLSPKSWPRIRREADWDTDVNAVTVSVFPGDLDQFLKFQRSLFKDERGWRFAGRAGVSNPGVEIDTPCCVAIRGASEAGSYGKDGYRGMAERPIAIVVGTNRVARIEADPSLSLSDPDLVEDDRFDRLMMSLEFR